MEQVKRYSTTPALIADALRAEICGGLIAPGDALRQEEIAERFSVSRIPAREALLRLESEGLVVIYPNRGAFVAQLTRDEIGEVYDLRITLESDLLSRAVPLVGPGDVMHIKTAILMAEQAGAGPDWSRLDWNFHRALYAPAGRTRQLAMIEGLRATVDRYWMAYAKLTEQTTEWLDDHDQIAAAVLKGQTNQAVTLLRQHLQHARDFVQSQIPLN